MAVTDTLKDAAYVTVGIGVLGFQKAQVRRVELTKQLEEQVKTIEAQVAEGRKTVAGLATQIDSIVAPVRHQVEAQLDTIEAALPASFADLVKQARTAAHQTEDAVRKSLGVSA
jgi:hypothetical protein